MPQSQRLSSANPYVAIERPACRKCKAPMMLASIEPARAGVDLHTFECAICNHVLKTFAAYEDPHEVQGSWTLASRRFAPAEVRPARREPASYCPANWSGILTARTAPRSGSIDSLTGCSPAEADLAKSDA